MSFDANRLTQLGRVSAFDIHPDGTWLAVEVARADEEVKRYRSELWRVSVHGEATSKLFEGLVDDKAPRFDASGQLLFLSNRTDVDHGPEDASSEDTRTQIWRLNPDTGVIAQQTDEPLGISGFKEAKGQLVCLAPVLPGVAEKLQQ